MEQRARELLCRTGDPDDICFQWQADMRYLGQGFEVTVPLPNGPLDPAHIEQLRESFNATYRDLFDRIAHNVPIEVVNWRLNASLPAQVVGLAYSSVHGSAERPARMVNFPGFGGVHARVYDRYALKVGETIRGPAIFEERETTFSIGPDALATVDGNANLIVAITYPE